MTTILVVGATGMTGRLLVQQLLGRGHRVRVIVRSPDKLPDDVANNPKLTLTRAAVLDLTDAQMKDQVNG
ncbi:MAG: NAD(P)H-binding protein, partial [Alphaproteobacteria bacterium]